MARSKKQREQHRTSVVEVDGEFNAEVIIPIESLEWTSGRQVTAKQMRRWLSPVAADRSTQLQSSGHAVSVVFDAFAFTLFVTTDDDGIEFTATHDGPAFSDVMVRQGSVDLFVTSGVDVRRAGATELADAARSGSILGARTTAFAVQAL